MCTYFDNQMGFNETSTGVSLNDLNISGVQSFFRFSSELHKQKELALQQSGSGILFLFFDMSICVSIR